MSPFLESFQIGVAPPIREITGRIKLSPLVVEAVRHFMTDHRPHATIVESVVSFSIKKWRLQDSRREDDLVYLRLVVGIHSWWRHGPLHSVHRPANFV